MSRWDLQVRTLQIEGMPLRLMLTLGTGYTSAGLISLGLQAPLVLSPNTFGTTDTNVAELVKVLGIMAGTFLLLFAFWFFCVSTLAVISGLKDMTFTLNWWAFIFPNGGLTLGAIQMGKAFNNSPGVNGICSALTIMLVVLWLVVAVFNIKALWQGTILWPGKDEDKDMKAIRWGRAANAAQDTALLEKCCSIRI